MGGEASGRLVDNLVLFGRALRRLGMEVTPAQLQELVRALAQLDLARRDDVKDAARAVLVSRREQIPLFDRAFDLFWRSWEGWQGPGFDLDVSTQENQAQERLQPALESGENGQASPESPEEQEAWLLRYSAQERLRHKDFAQLTPQERRQVQQLIQEMRWAWARRRSRRLVASQGSGRLDLRRTFRRNLRHGGEMLGLARRQPKEKARPLVLLCDISGSMESYTRMLLQFLHAVTQGGMAQGRRRVETFVFGTRLTRITPQLRQGDVDQALAQAGRAVQDWAGGTRMGQALRTFNRHWSRRVLGQGALALIISDGWDRGEPALLAQEMARLQRSCHRLIWLNPLLGSPDYRPLTRGMQAALPFVDAFLPVHNLASLEQLAALLEAGLEPRRYPRQGSKATQPRERA